MNQVKMSKSEAIRVLIEHASRTFNDALGTKYGNTKAIEIEDETSLIFPSDGFLTFVKKEDHENQSESGEE